MPSELLLVLLVLHNRVARKIVVGVADRLVVVVGWGGSIVAT